MVDASKINSQIPSTNKHRIVTISVIVGIILLLLLAVSYFGVLNRSHFMSSADSGYYESSSLSIEVGHGKFSNAESSLRQIVSQAGATIYNERINEYNGAKSAYFTIDVPESSVDNLINNLRGIGTVKSFSYSKGTYQRNNYGKEGLQQGYVRVTVSLNEKKSVFSSFNSLEASALGSTFSGSIVALFYFVVAILPWVVVILVIYFLVRYLKRKFGN